MTVVHRMLIALAAAIIGHVPGASADDFYKGATIKIVAGTGAGSAAGLHSRAIQQHLGTHVPGNPTVVLQHMPAGGGLAAANHLYNVADKSGAELGVLNRNTMFFPLFGLSNANYKPDGFEWIGTAASYRDNAWIFIYATKVKPANIEELLASNVVLNVAGIGPENPFIAIIRTVFGVKMKFITGYKGQEMGLAFERGEVDAFGGGYNTLPSTAGSLTPEKFRFLVQFRAGGRLPELANVPNGRELAKNPDDMALIDLAETSLTLGFPLAGPPGMPKDRVAILRTAFRDMTASEDYKALGKKMSLEYSPMLGEDLQAVLQKLAATPAPVIARYKALLGR